MFNAARARIRRLARKRRGSVFSQMIADLSTVINNEHVSDNSGNDQGWDGATQPGTDTEWIEFDLGQTEPIDRVGVYSVDKSDDPQWFPTHNPGQVVVLARAAPSDPWAALANQSKIVMLSRFVTLSVLLIQKASLFQGT